MKVKLSGIEDKFGTVFGRNRYSVVLLFKINRHILLALLYYVSKNSTVICNLSGNDIFSTII